MVCVSTIMNSFGEKRVNGHFNFKKKRSSIAISELYGREFCPKIKFMDLFFMHFVQYSDPLGYDNDKEFV